MNHEKMRIHEKKLKRLAVLNKTTNVVMQSINVVIWKYLARTKDHE